MKFGRHIHVGTVFDKQLSNICMALGQRRV
jgi:hypothetical protein